MKHQKRFWKNPFFGLVVTLICLSLIIVSRHDPNASPLKGELCFLRTGSSLLAGDAKKALFVSQYDLSAAEPPDLVVVQKNSLKEISAPLFLEPKVLATFSGQEEGASQNEITEYSVEAGDTLLGIANRFNISLETLLWANDLAKNSVIKPGQKLMILPVSGALHLVKSGDTLSQIAEDYKADIKEVIAFNDLSAEGEIFKGDLLIIPGGVKPPEPTPYLPSASVATSYFISPTVGKISQGLHWYNAIDVANKCGTPVYAAAGGTVQSRIGYAPVSGNYVRILHPNGIVTFYGHLSKILVGPGQKVSQGEIIGYMGNTGFTVGRTGCHLHFEVRGARNFLASYPLGSHIGP